MLQLQVIGHVIVKLLVLCVLLNEGCWSRRGASPKVSRIMVSLWVDAGPAGNVALCLPLLALPRPSIELSCSSHCHYLK